MSHPNLVKRDLAALLRLSWPVVLSRLGIMTMGLVDAIVVGHYSAVHLGYQTLGWAPTSVLVTTAIGLLAGIQVMTARHIGEGRPEATGGVYRRGLVYSLWLGLGAGALLLFLGPTALNAMDIEPSLAAGASAVLVVLALSMPFHLTSTAGMFFLEALSRPKPATIAMWLCNLVNLGLNLLLVPGALGFPELGAVGSAWATMVSRVLLAAIIFVYILRLKDARALGVFSKPIDGPVAAMQQRRVGYGGGASYFAEAGAFACMGLIAASIGEAAVAGWGVILNATGVIFMAPLGLSAATAVLVGQAYGAGKRGGMVRAGNLGFAVTAAVLTVVSLGVAIFPNTIAGFYTNDASLIGLAAGALVLGSLYFIFDGLQAVAAQALRARGDVLMPTITHVISYALLMVPLAWWLAIDLDMGLVGIVWAVVAASIAAAAFLLARFWILARRG
jgi:multidrug resistance protein, MATE family